MLSCRQATRLASEGLDRRLSWLERLRLGMHFLMCRACVYARQRMLFLREAGQRFRQVEADGAPAAPRLSPAARARIQRPLDEGTA